MIFLFCCFMAGACMCVCVCGCVCVFGCQEDLKAWPCIVLQSAAVHLDHQEERGNHKRLMQETATPHCSPFCG